MGLVVGLLLAVWTGRKGTFRSYQPPEPQRSEGGAERLDAVRNLQEWVTAVERHQERAALRLALLVRVSLAAGMGRLAIWLAS